MTKKSALIIFAIALVVRLVYLGLVYDGPDSLQYPDSAMYLEMAEGLRATGAIGVLQPDGSLANTTERTPGYVYFIVGVQSIFGESLLAVVIVQAVIDAGLCILIGVMAGLINSRLAFVAGIVAALNVNLIIHSVSILTDNLFLVPFVVGLSLSFLYFKRPSLWLALALGGCFAVTLLIRPVMFYFPPVLMTVMAVFAWHYRLGFIKTVAHVGVIAVCFVAVLTPFMYKNYKDYGYFDYISQTGTHALYWIYPGANEYANGVSRQDSVEHMYRLVDEYRAQVETPAPASNPFAQSAELKAVAKDVLLDLGPFALLKAWTIGSAFNLTAPAVIGSPVIRNMDRPSFTLTTGANAYEKVANYLSANPQFTMLMLPAILLTVLARLLTAASLIQFIPGVRPGTWPERTLDILPSVFLIVVGGYILAVTGPVTGVKYRLATDPIMDVFLSAALVWLYDMVQLRRAR